MSSNSSVRNSDKKKKTNSMYYTGETIGMIIMLFSVICLLLLFTREKLFGDIGVYVNSFFLGILGYASYPALLGVLYLGLMLVIGKKRKNAPNRRLRAAIVLLIALVACLVHAITMREVAPEGFGEYLVKSYNMGASGISGSSGGGIIFAALVYPVVKVITYVGAYVLYSMFIVLSCYLIYKFAVTTDANLRPDDKTGDNIDRAGLMIKDYPDTYDFSTAPSGEKRTGGLYYGEDDEFALKTKREIKQEQKEESKDRNRNLKILYPSMSVSDITKPVAATPSASTPTSSEPTRDNGLDFTAPHDVAPRESYQDKLSYITKPMSTEEFNEYIATPRNIVPKEQSSFGGISRPISSSSSASGYSAYQSKRKAAMDSRSMPPKITHEGKTLDENPDISIFGTSRAMPLRPRIDPVPEAQVAPKQDEEIIEDKFIRDINIDPKPVGNRAGGAKKILEEINNTGDEPRIKPITESDNPRLRGGLDFSKPDEEVLPSRRSVGFNAEPVSRTPDPAPANTKEEPEVEIVHHYAPYSAPQAQLFNKVDETIVQDPNETAENARIIEETLANFKIPATVTDIISGPSVTRYELEMPVGVSVSKIMSYESDLTMRLASVSGIRIEAPILGKDKVGIEVPNKKRSPVGLLGIVESDQFKSSKKDALTFALGKDVVGKTIVANMCSMPHMLVAGSTGAGKSVFLNCLIISMIMKYSPEDMRFILVDPKRVEFSSYASLPHLLIDEIITDANRAIVMLNWAVVEMENRFQLFNEQRVKNIEEYNASIDLKKSNKLPKIVIIVDELNDLMSVNKQQLEEKIVRLTQKARAAGIHLVLATQRPSADVITGIIKANLPSVVAFRVSSQINSRIILDEGGAEFLLGNGDMLFRSSQMPKPIRVQGAYVSNEEINRIVDYVRDNNESYFYENVTQFINAQKQQEDQQNVDSDSGDREEGNNSGDDDKFVETCINALRQIMLTGQGQASISMIQRKLGYGYAKAGKIIDWLEVNGYISGYEGSKSRRVLISKEDFESRYGQI